MADNFTTRIQQVALKQEATPGTAETLTAADAKIRPYADAEQTPDFNRFTNDEVSDDLGEAPDFVSGKKGSISVGATIVGSGAVGTAPFLGRYLIACGCKEEAVKTITIGAPSGGDNEFAEGEAWTSSAKSGIVEQTISGAGTFRYILDDGSADLVDTDVITVAGDSDVATASGSAGDYGTRYTLRSQAHEPTTIARYVANYQDTASQDFITTLRGALGNAVIQANAHDVLRLQCELSGVWHSAAAGSMLTGITYESAANSALPKFINSNIQLDGVLVTAPAAFTLDFGNQVELDADPTTVGGAEGYDFARILARQPTISIDPRRIPPGTFDDLAKLGDGSEMIFSFVSSGSAGQIIEVVANVQMRQWTEAERANLQTANYVLNVVRRSVKDTDLKIYFK